MTANVLTCTTPVTCDKCGREVPAGEYVLGVAVPKAILVACEACGAGVPGLALVTALRPDLELDGPRPRPSLEDLALAEELKKIKDGDLEAEPVPETEAEVLAFPLPELDTDEVDDGAETLRGGA